jgi:hypothetical protein
MFHTVPPFMAPDFALIEGDDESGYSPLAPGALPQEVATKLTDCLTGWTKACVSANGAASPGASEALLRVVQLLLLGYGELQLQRMRTQAGHNDRLQFEISTLPNLVAAEQPAVTPAGAAGGADGSDASDLISHLLNAPRVEAQLLMQASMVRDVTLFVVGLTRRER